MAFDPEAVAQSGVAGDVVDAGFAGVGYDGVVVGGGDRTGGVVGAAGEEVLMYWKGVSLAVGLGIMGEGTVGISYHPKT